MIKSSVRLFVLLFSVTLIGCGGKPTTRSFEAEDADNYMNNGLQAFLDADWGRAQWLFSRALTLYEGMDNQRGVLYSHINLAEVALSVHRYSESLRHLGIATHIVESLSLKSYHARIKILYALIAVEQKQMAQAKGILQELLPEFNQLIPSTVPDMNQMTAIAIRTKVAFIQNKEEVLWTQRYAKAIDLAESFDSDLQLRLLRFQSNLLERQGKYVDAELNLQQALAGYKTMTNRPGTAETLLELGFLYKVQERWKESKFYLNRAMAVFRYLSDADKVAQVSESLEEVDKRLIK